MKKKNNDKAKSNSKKVNFWELPPNEQMDLVYWGHFARMLSEARTNKKPK